MKIFQKSKKMKMGLKLGMATGLILIGITGALKINDFNLFSSVEVEAEIVKCNTNNTDSTGKCSHNCGASQWCDGLAPLTAIPYCAKGGSTAIHDRCSSTCQPEDRLDMMCRKSGISDCTGDFACDLIISGSCSSNSLKKCNSSCEEIASCGDGICNCKETTVNCAQDCKATDAKTSIGVLRPSLNPTWYYDFERDGDTDKKIQWGAKTDLPVVGDFDRDGITGNLGAFCPFSGMWYFDNDLDGNTDKTVGPWGNSGDLPIVGDFDSDGFSDDVGVFRNGAWYFDYNHNGNTDASVGWGIAGDLPIVGDFDSDGFSDDVGVFRNGAWYFDYNHNGNTDASVNWGLTGDKPVVGDFDNDGYNDDIGTFRNGQWEFDYNHNGNTDASIIYGIENDLPFVGYFDKECAPKVRSACYNYNVYWFDSCNNRGELKETCGCGCNNGVCVKPCAEKSLPKIQVSLGQEEIVFDWTTDRCEDYDIPDLPTRAFRDADNKIQLIATHYTSRRFIGDSLDNLKRDCNIILDSSYNADPSKFNDHEWISSVYTLDGKNIYALIHNEYQGHIHDGMCETKDYFDCWYNSVTSAFSTDKGKTYHQKTAPEHTVVYPLLKQSKYSSAPSGYHEPGKIIKHTDGYYYVFVKGETSYQYIRDKNGIIQEDSERRIGPQDRGPCLMRTKNIKELSGGEETKWLFWDGQDFTIESKNPYQETFNPKEQVCATLDNIQMMHSSLTWNTYLNKYFLVDRRQIDGGKKGFYFSLSDNLIQWSEPQFLGYLNNIGRESGLAAYPSIVDPEVMINGIDTQTRNFDKSDNTFYLYFTRANKAYPDNWDNPSIKYLDRDLIRVPVTLTSDLIPVPTCADTDGGNNIYEKGTTCRPSTVTSGLFCQTDTCVSATSLKEFYCNGDTMVSKTIACANGCVSGACAQEPGVNHNPIGFLDVADKSQIIGWAYDKNAYTDPIDVHIYIDGQYSGSTIADLNRPDLVDAGVCPDPYHGFSYPTPTGLSVGEHTAQAYAINYPEGTNRELIGSPMTFTISDGTGMLYLNNGEVKVGVNLDWGGAISEIIHNGINLVDNSDAGTLIQTALYDGNGPYEIWDGPDWGWDPVQGGDKYDHGSPVVGYNQSENLIYTKTRPYQWNPDNKGGGPDIPVLSDIYIEQWVSLGVPEWPHAVKVDYKITSFEKENHSPAPQDFPCMFCNGNYFSRCITYNGDNPWTNDAVTEIDARFPPSPENTYFSPTEYWASFVNEQNYGLTSYSVDRIPQWIGRRVDSHTPPQSLISTMKPFDIPVGNSRETTQYFLVGNYDDVRSIIYTLHSNEPSFSTSWEFNTNKDTEDWFPWSQLTPFNVSDGLLKTSSVGDDPYMGFASGLGINASEYKYIKIKMKVTAGNQAVIYFATPTNPAPSESTIKRFSITPGNSFQTYTIDMSTAPEWKGMISQIRLDPTDTIANIEIDYIKLKKDTATCTDTDGGQNIYEKGTTCTSFCKTDVCLSSTSLKEFYCNGDTMVSKTIACANGCVDGACAQESFVCNSDHTDSTGKCHHDCGASAGCHGKNPNSCSSNLLKKCDSNCQEVSSCGDGTCNCGETTTNCSQDCSGGGGYDECGNEIGWSEPESAAKQCGWPRGSKGFIVDCCSCFIQSHIHDLGAIFTNREVEIKYVPGLYRGCTSPMTVSSSADGILWKEVLTKTITQGTWSPKTTYNETIVVSEEFRYIKIYIPYCYNDYSSAKIMGGTEESCTDTDGGNNIYEQGTTCTSFCKTDVCLSSTSLKEFYCNGDTMVSKTIACANGCVDGACAQEPGVNHNPIGFLDVADKSQIVGWAYDEDAYNDPIDVHIYVDGQYSGSTTANLNRPDLVDAGVALDPNHGFTFSTPSDLSVGQHTVNTYAINYPEGTNPQLIGSPKRIVIEGDLPISNNTLVKTENNPGVYQIINNKKHWIPSSAAFASYGFSIENVIIISETELNLYPLAKLIKNENDHKIYYLNQTSRGIFKRYLINSDVFLSYGNKWGDSIIVNDIETQFYGNINLIKTKDNPDVYLIQENNKMLIASPEIFNTKGFDWEKIVEVNDTEMNNYETKSL